MTSKEAYDRCLQLMTDGIIDQHLTDAYKQYLGLKKEEESPPGERKSIPKIEIEHWEADEFIITLNGKVLGYSLNKRDAELIAGWLRSAAKDILSALESK